MHAPSDETKVYINEVTNGHLENSESTIPHGHSKPVRTELHFQRANEGRIIPVLLDYFSSSVFWCWFAVSFFFACIFVCKNEPKAAPK